MRFWVFCVALVLLAGQGSAKPPGTCGGAGQDCYNNYVLQLQAKNGDQKPCSKLAAKVQQQDCINEYIKTKLGLQEPALKKACQRVTDPKKSQQCLNKIVFAAMAEKGMRKKYQAPRAVANGPPLVTAATSEMAASTSTVPVAVTAPSAMSVKQSGRRLYSLMFT